MKKRYKELIFITLIVPILLGGDFSFFKTYKKGGMMSVKTSSDDEKKTIPEEKSDGIVRHHTNNTEDNGKYQQSCSLRQAFDFAKEVRSQNNKINALYTPYYEDLLSEHNDGYRCVSDFNKNGCRKIISAIREEFEGNRCRGGGGNANTQNCSIIQFQRGVILSDLIHGEGPKGGDTPLQIFATIDENSILNYRNHLRCWKNKSQQSKSARID